MEEHYTTYTLKMESCDGSVITFTGHAETLPEIMQDIRQWLLGSGFHPNTVNEYIEEP